jgi:hypothetical protein
MPDNFIGPKRDNQVTEAEYEKIAHTYSDVRMGRGDLKVDTSTFDGANKDADAARYKQGAMDDIANMMMTSGGRSQIEGLHNNVKVDDKGDAEHTGFMGMGKSFLGPEVHRETNIVPLFGVNGGLNAKGQTIWNDPGAGKHDWSTMRTDNGYADPVNGSKMYRDATTGARGEGTDVNIRFNPEANNIGGTGARSDVILAHEMNHTINETQGTMANGKQTSGPDNGVNNFERQAVGLSRTDSPGGGHFPGDPDGCSENTYRQQRNELGLGERWLPREKYNALPGQAANDADLQTAWKRQNASGNARP